jgi:hypothetical protein
MYRGKLVAILNEIHYIIVVKRFSQVPYCYPNSSVASEEKTNLKCSQQLKVYQTSPNNQCDHSDRISRIF